MKDPRQETPPEGSRPDVGALQSWMVTRVSGVLGVAEEAVGVDDPFVELGLSSRDAVVLVGELEEHLGVELSPTLPWDHPTIRALALHLARPEAVCRPSPVGQPRPSSANGAVAIIGLSCRFPGAGSADEFWKLLREGGDAIREVPPDRWDAQSLFDPDEGAPGRMSSRWGGFLDDVGRFDAEFFGISPREAAGMDPQQRLMLEVAWEALESAGLVPGRLAGTPAAVYVGISSNDYAHLQVGTLGLIDAYAGTGNARSLAANRISYLLDLRGESLSVDTACSSSLVAVHLACQALRNGASDLALAGGVNVILSPEITMTFSRARMMAADGRCKAFDASADGYVRGEGCGVVVLKRLSEAMRDGDPIVAVIRGSAVNQDGRSNGLTAPSLGAQREVLRAALAAAGLEPAAVGYVEAHGTGTSLGDPIEVGALSAVYGEGRSWERPLLVGSVKTNVGHLESAAGMAGLIKVALMLRHREVPASLHYQRGNPHIPFASIPVRVQERLEGWREGERPARAGVSSFGFGGTNAHVIVEEFEGGGQEESAEGDGWKLLPVSARSREGLRAMVEALKEDVERREGRSLGDVCYTASVRRSHHEHRAAFTVRSGTDLIGELESFCRGKGSGKVSHGEVRGGGVGRPVFVYSGQGTQWAGMGVGLLSEKRFREVVEECDGVIRGEAGWSLLEELGRGEEESRLGESAVVQPALLSIQLGLTALWRSWGIEPAAVVGHSLGEVAAAQVAGVLTLGEAVRLAVHRGRVLGGAGRGRMVSVSLSHEEVERELRGFEDRVSIGAINGRRMTVLSGEPEALEELCGRLKKRKVSCVPLPVEHAFHSVRMEACRGELVEGLGGLRPREGSLPMVSTVSGERIEGLALDGRYWGRNLREPVRFQAAMDTLLEGGHTVFVEVGAHATLSGAMLECLGGRGITGTVVSSLRRHQDEKEWLLRSLGRLYVWGQEVDWSGVHPRGRCVSLPTYRFQRQRYWIEEERPGRKVEEPRWKQWTYEVGWRPAIKAGTARVAEEAGEWLIFGDRGGTGEELRRELDERGERCVVVYAGEGFRGGEGRYEIDAASAGDFRRLVTAVSNGRGIRGVVHLWSLDGTGSDEATVESLRRDVRLSCGSVLHLVQALSGRGGGTRLWLVTRKAQAVTGGAEVAVTQAPLWGLGRVIGLEHPELWGGLLDLEGVSDVPRLLEEVWSPEGEDQVAFRDGQRYAARLVRRLGKEETVRPVWGAEGTYLITGGLGGLGLRVARRMVEEGVRDLVLIGRRGLPARSEGGALGAGSEAGGVMEAIGTLEGLGARVRVIRADVSDLEQMRSVFEALSGSRLRGVIHVAGVLRLQSVLDTDVASFEEVVRPKVLGSWVLEELTRDMDLDVFTLFSSAAGVWGSRGLGSYAAGNQFLDALAHHRRGRGVRALSVAWGPWADEGMASEEARRLLSRMGVRAMSVEEGGAAFAQMAGTELTQVTVADVDWERFRPVYEAKAKRPFLAEIPLEGSALPGSRPDLAQRLHDARPEERPALLGAHLQEAVRDVLGLPAETSLDPHKGFFEMGMDSLMAVDLAQRLQSSLGHPLSAPCVFDHPTIDSLAQYLLQDLLALQPRTAPPPRPDAPRRVDAIAVLGAGCRLPGGVRSPASFWSLLTNGGDAITEVPKERWDADSFYDPDPDAPGRMTTRWGGFLEGVDQFDPQFFNIAPREAVAMDPQQRLLLEVAWEALEDAGLPAARLKGSATGVFVGISGNDYLQLQMRHGLSRINPHFATGNSLSIAAARISHVLGLHGPSLSVDTACSSSLVAVHLACQSLRLGESDLALAAGVNLVLSPQNTVCLSKARMMAADGRCKAFDASADGYVRGEGCGVVVLKRLSEAMRDGDPIVAVIRGSAVNQDGPSSALTVPNGTAQREVLRAALAAAGLEPAAVGYVEAHGTGTSLGDPIEVGALSAVYGEGRSWERPLLVGSVKTNVGHLESAAGMAGLIKVALMLRHREVPASLHYQRGNPHIPFASIPVRVQERLEGWREGERPARAGVSSFGFGGTNAHVIVEEFEGGGQEESAEGDGWKLLPVSARSREGLRAMVEALKEDVERREGRSLGDVCYTASVRRSHHEHRAAFTVRSGTDLIGELESFCRGKGSGKVSHGEVRGGGVGRPVFVYSGQGTQWAGMGVGLLSEKRFREVVEECDGVIRGEAGWSLLEELGRGEEESRLGESAVVQPALLSIQLGLTALWRSWGIEPAAVVGHSLGEVAAAQVAGVLTLGEAVRLAVHRGRVLGGAGRGRMVSVSLSHEEVERELRGFEDRVSIGAINGRRMTVLSGEPEALEELCGRLKKRKVSCVPLPVEHAFHSVRMEACRGELVEGLGGLRPREGSLPMVSTVSGERIEGLALDGRYWGRNLREPVRFQAAMDTLLEGGHTVFVEVGAHATLSGAMLECLGGRGITGTVVSSLRRHQDEKEWLLRSLGRLYVWGQEVDWSGVHPRGRCVSLPTYRFQRQRYWIEEERPGRKVEEPRWKQWTYEVGWRPAIKAGTARVAEEAGEWLIFGDRGGTGEELRRELDERGERCVVVYAGEGFRGGEGRYEIDAASAGDFRRLVTAVSNGRGIRGVVHLWSLDGTGSDEATVESLRRDVRLSCGSVLHLVQALSGRGGGTRLWLVTRKAQAVTGGAEVAVTQAPLWGLGRVIGLEHPELWGGLLDLEGVSDVPRLLEEVWSPEGEDQVAFRDGQRYAARLVRRLGKEETVRPVWGAEGTYLITGGLGGLGLRVARRMVEEGVRDLVLIGRRGLPARSEGGALGAGSEAGGVMEAIGTLEGLGARVRVIRADVSDLEQMRSVFEALSGSRLRGVIHVAGVLRLQSVLDTDVASFEEVVRPKVLGSWVLEELTRDMDLDVFTLFSSAAGVWGSRGLGSYAAGNQFLDALAHHRRGRGVRALSVAWGPWADEGMASEEARRLLSRMGVRAMSVEEGGAAFAQMAGTELTQVTVADVDWERFRPVYEAKAKRPFLAEIPLEGSALPGSRPDLAQRLHDARPEERPALLGAHLQEAVRDVLGLPAETSLDPHKGFFEMGMDSLMAVDLAQRLQSSLGHPLSAPCVFDHPTIDSLAQYLLQDLLALQPRTAPPPRPDALPTFLEEVEKLTDAEAEARLRERLAALEL